jgi:HEAT repeat protein
MSWNEPERSADDRASRARRAAIAGHEADGETARAFLGDGDPSVRATALGALARARALDAMELRAATEDQAVAVRRRSAELLATLPAAALPVSLLPLLEDRDASVAEMAAWAAGERHEGERVRGPDPTPAVVDRLRRLAVDHDDALVREAAVASLGSIGAAAGLDTILTALTDKPTVRRRAVIALAPFEGPAVDAALEAATHDRDWQVRQAAEELR